MMFCICSAAFISRLQSARAFKIFVFFSQGALKKTNTTGGECVGKYRDMLFVAHSNQGSAESVCAHAAVKRKKQDQSSCSAHLTMLIVAITASVMHVQQPPSIQTKGINHPSAPGNMCEAPAAKKKINK